MRYNPQLLRPNHLEEPLIKQDHYQGKPKVLVQMRLFQKEV